ncbi:MAG: co-chaperone GroES [Chlamydiales bacterium]|nr:co-chaperone GroES [Chlamydiales bacterium]
MTQTVNKTKLKPLGARVIVQRLEEEEKIGGIILPDSAKKKPETAKVIAVGTGKDMPDVKVGDTVLMDKYAGQDVTVNDQEFTILRADDVIAVIEE